MAEVGKTKPFNFNKLVEQALLSLKEIDLQIVDPINKSGKKRYKGSSMNLVIKFILENNDFLSEDSAKRRIKVAAKKMLVKEELVNVTGKGLTGKLRLSEEMTKAPKKATKKTEKKPTKKKPVKKKSKNENNKEEDSKEENSELDSDLDSETTSKLPVKGQAPKTKVDSKKENSKEEESKEENSELDSELDSETISKPPVKGRAPKTKVVSKVVKKKSTKKVADLTKPPPKAKAKTTSAKAKLVISKEDATKPSLYDEILKSDPETTPVQPATKTAKKTKIIPTSDEVKVGDVSSEDEEPLKTKIKPPAKNKKRVAKKKPLPKPIYSDSAQSETEL